MEITLSQRDQDAIVQKLRIALRKDLKEMLADTRQPDMVDINEASRILGKSKGRIRQICCEDPHRYPHIKDGDTKQARLLFFRDALLK